MPEISEPIIKIPVATGEVSAVNPEQLPAAEGLGGLTVGSTVDLSNSETNLATLPVVDNRPAMIRGEDGSPPRPMQGLFSRIRASFSRDNSKKVYIASEDGSPPRAYRTKI